MVQLAALQSPFFVNKLDINLLIKKVVSCDYPPIPSDVFSKEVNENYSINLLLAWGWKNIQKDVCEIYPLLPIQQPFERPLSVFSQPSFSVEIIELRSLRAAGWIRTTISRLRLCYSVHLFSGLQKCLFFLCLCVITIIPTNMYPLPNPKCLLFYS